MEHGSLGSMPLRHVVPILLVVFILHGHRLHVSVLAVPKQSYCKKNRDAFWSSQAGQLGTGRQAPYPEVRPTPQQWCE